MKSAVVQIHVDAKKEPQHSKAVKLHFFLQDLKGTEGKAGDKPGQEQRSTSVVLCLFHPSPTEGHAQGGMLSFKWASLEPDFNCESLTKEATSILKQLRTAHTTRYTGKGHQIRSTVRSTCLKFFIAIGTLRVAVFHSVV